MELRLEDLQTEELHTIDAAGATLGRDSRRSSITIPDPGVSGAHARIFARSGRYYIEDTNSSNGTFVEGTRLRGELELKDGIVIALHKYKFRVSVASSEAAAGEATALYEQKTIGQKASAKSDAPRAMQQARTVMHEESDDADIAEHEQLAEGSSIHRNVPVAGDDEPVAPRKSKNKSKGRRDSGTIDGRRDSGSLNEGSLRESGSRRREVSVDDELAEGGDREVSELGPAFNGGDVQGGFGRALAYYMGAVPKLAFGPVGATQRLIAEQPFPPLEKMDLVVWAAPPLILGAIITVIATIILSLVTHTFGIGAIIRPIISGAIGVVVGCVVAGWVWHPLVNWWIRLLKGESNPRGRTNMFVALYTGVALTQIVAGVGVLFALLAGIPVIGPFIQIAPLVLTTGAGLVSLYIMYAWHGHFRVMDLVPKIFMVLGVLLLASTAWSVIGLVRASVASASAAAQAAKAQEAVAAAQADAAKLQEQVAAAAKRVDNRDDDSPSANADTQAKGDAPSKSDTPAASPRPTQSDRPSPTAANDRGATPAVTTSPTPPSSRPEPARGADDVTRSAPKSSGGKPTYAELNDHIDAIEKAVTADPSLLSRMEGALNLYKKMHATQAKYKAKTKDPVAERIRQAELYGALVDTVEELYEKVAR